MEINPAPCEGGKHRFCTFGVFSDGRDRDQRPSCVRAPTYMTDKFNSRSTGTHKHLLLKTLDAQEILFMTIFCAVLD